MTLLITTSVGFMLVAFASGHQAWGLIAAAAAAIGLVVASAIVSGASFYDRHHHKTPHVV